MVAAVEARGLVFDTLPIVGFGPNSANPHYEPHAGRDATLRAGEVVLLDLWAGRSRTTVFADQTWMGFAGSRVPPRGARRCGRRCAARGTRRSAAVRTRRRQGRPIAGFEADRAARAVIEAAGFGERFVHRTGHSIDRDLHGSGPHLDDYETHDDRRLVPGVGFSVEPGVYLPGRVRRAERGEHVLGRGGPEVTPREPQRELISPRRRKRGRGARPLPKSLRGTLESRPSAFLLPHPNTHRSRRLLCVAPR